MSCDSLSKALNLMSWFIELLLAIGAWTAILPWSVLTTEDAEFGLRVGDGLVHKKSKFRVVRTENWVHEFQKVPLLV